MITLYFLLGLATAFLVIRPILEAFRPGLGSIPGPFWAKFTDLWRLLQSRKGTANHVMPKLVAQYGDVVRIGPNIVYVNEPGIGERLMNHKNNYSKSDAMKVWQQAREGKITPGIATTQDTEIHAQLRRPIAGIYSNSNVLQFEPNVRDTNRYFVKRLDEEFIQGENAGRPCDIDNWVQYYAFDIVGEITLSKKLGFLEEGRDIDGMLEALNDEFAYRGVAQNMPWIEMFWRKNPLYLAIFKPTHRFMAHAMKLTMQRRAETKDIKEKGDAGLGGGKVDFMQRFLEAQRQHSEFVTDTVLNGYVVTNFVAGSDTTAVTMRSIIYYVLRTPGVLSRLREELDAHLSNAEDYPVSYKHAVDMPYLQATIYEAMRIHHIGAGAFERILPAEGLTLESGIKLPGGTIVATSPWTTNFEGSCYDDGVDPVREFCPQRWLQRAGESDEIFAARFSEMKRNDLSFSIGPRGCLGKWIALLEIYTVIPTLFGLFDFEFVHPDKPWLVDGTFFTRQSEMDIRIKWRQGVDRSLYV